MLYVIGRMVYTMEKLFQVPSYRLKGANGVSGNFSFLTDQFPALESIGSLAENYLYSDPNSCLYKIGIFAETIVNYMYELDGMPQLPCGEDSFANRIKKLKYEGMLTREIDDILYALRKKRNIAVHEGYGSTPGTGVEDCKTLLRMTHTLSVWFMQTYGDYSYKPAPFVLPENSQNKDEQQKLIEENEKLAVELGKAKASSLSPSIDITVDAPERKKRAGSAVNKLRLSEEETRLLIDQQLLKVGWEADSENLKYSRGTRPQKGRNIAIAEWPTDSSVCKWGKADYALFIGLKMVGVVEAKAAHKDISSVIDNQCREYSMGIKEEHASYLVGTWGIYKVPFLFATNGRLYLRQLETKSGVWFRDARQDSNIPKALQGWIDPQGLLDMLDKDIISANRKLSETTYDLLSDPDGLNLRPYQIEAIEKAEAAIVRGRQTALLAMATGTGKTRTVLGIIYRSLKTGRFKRILFLVDRTALGEQAQDVFREVKIEDLMTLDEIYNIKNLDDKDIDKETKIHVATVQSLVKRVLYNDTDTIPSVTDYDLIIVDEAHRGYILDKEIGNDEQLYRNQIDYLSKYRTVIEYFDAVKIALTATPALHTTEIFGKPVFEYTYRRAVIEGYLVDHDAPHNGLEILKTEQQVKNQIDMIIAKIQRKKKKLSDEALAQFCYFCDRLDPTQFIAKIIGMNTTDAKKYILSNAQLFKILEEGYLPNEQLKVVSEKPDKLLAHTRGYGQGKTPQDYLDEFGEFIKNNINTIVALKVVCTRPRELTRESLKNLKMELGSHYFTEQRLNTAWHELKNEEIAADIISYIRRYALGSVLISHEERIKSAMDKLRRNYCFTKMELDWLANIEKTLLSETVIDREIFDTGAFKTYDGFMRINKIFDGKLESYLEELNGYLYDEGEKLA